MCGCKGNVSNNNVYVPVPISNTSIDCSYTRNQLELLKTKIDNFIISGKASIEDFNLLQIYRGKVLSGLNLNNYCFADYNDVNNIIDGIISKYI